MAFSPAAHRPPASAAPANSALKADFEPRSDLPALFFVEALDGGAAAASYEAQTRQSDGARKDALTLGDPSLDGPFLRVTARIGGISAAQSLFFVDMARQAAEIGEAVSHASNPQEAAGASQGLLISEVTLAAGGRQRACLGFRFDDVGPVDLSGVACGGVGQPVERASLECLISRIEPTAAGKAAALDKVLEGPARKSGC